MTRRDTDCSPPLLAECLVWAAVLAVAFILLAIGD